MDEQRLNPGAQRHFAFAQIFKNGTLRTDTAKWIKRNISIVRRSV